MQISRTRQIASAAPVKKTNETSASKEDALPTDNVELNSEPGVGTLLKRFGVAYGITTGFHAFMLGAASTASYPAVGVALLGMTGVGLAAAYGYGRVAKDAVVNTFQGQDKPGRALNAVATVAGVGTAAAAAAGGISLIQALESAGAAGNYGAAAGIAAGYLGVVALGAGLSDKAFFE